MAWSDMEVDAMDKTGDGGDSFRVFQRVIARMVRERGRDDRLFWSHGRAM